MWELTKPNQSRGRLICNIQLVSESGITVRDFLLKEHRVCGPGGCEIGQELKKTLGENKKANKVVVPELSFARKTVTGGAN